METPTKNSTTIVVRQNFAMLFIDWPFFLFHLSLIWFILVKVIKKNANFKGGFYVLYLMSAIGDSLSFIQVIGPYRTTVANANS